MKLKNNQAGVAHLAAILIVVVIAVVGFVGWKVWDNNEKKQNSAATTNASDTKTGSPSTVDSKENAKTVDETKDWKTYSNSDYGISFKYPNNWTVSESVKNGFLTASASQITSAEIQANQSSLSKYNDYTKVTVSASKSKVEGGTSNTSGVLETVTYDNSKYSLLAQTYSGKNVAVSLADCTSSSYCSEWIKTPSNKYLGASIVSVANPGESGDWTVPLNTEGAQYMTASLIVKSLKF